MDLESRLESLTPRHSEAGIRKTAAMESLKVASEQASLAEAQATRFIYLCLYVHSLSTGALGSTYPVQYCFDAFSNQPILC